jgi:hypothetical protein
MAAFGVGGIDYLDQIMLDYPGPGTSSRSAGGLVVWILNSKEVTNNRCIPSIVLVLGFYFYFWAIPFRLRIYPRPVECL